MTTLLEEAIDRAQRLPPEAQDEMARLMLAYAGDPNELVDIDPDDEAAVLRSRGAAQRGEIATDGDMRALWAKYGL